MTKFVEAIYSHGMFEPLEALDLPKCERAGARRAMVLGWSSRKE